MFGGLKAETEISEYAGTRGRANVRWPAHLAADWLRWRWGLPLVALATLLRVAWVLAVPTVPVGDFATYRESANYLLEFGRFDPGFIYMPGFVFMLAAVAWLGGELVAQKMIGALLGSLADQWRRELLPRYQRTVAQGAAAADLERLVDMLGQLAGEYLWSLAIVGGSAWKMEACLTRFARRHLAAPHLHQHTDQPPHHLPQEVRRLDVQHDEVLVLVHVEGLEVHGRGLGAGIVVGKGAEVVEADERARRLAHAFGIAVLLDPPHIRLGKRRPPPRHLVDVAARHRVVPGMKPRRGGLDAQDVDVGGERVVDAPAKGFRRQLRGDLQVSHLAKRVDAGIGAA